MEPTRELIDALYMDKVRQARRMTPEQKMLAGPRLFDAACEVARMGIRMRHPDADESRVNELLLERLALEEKLEAHDVERSTGA